MKKKKTYGNTSLICGILSVLLIFMPYFGLPLGILAVVFANTSTKRNEITGNSTAGRILGIIGIILNGMMGLLAIFFIGIFGMI